MRDVNNRGNQREGNEKVYGNSVYSLLDVSVKLKLLGKKSL